MSHLIRTPAALLALAGALLAAQAPPAAPKAKPAKDEEQEPLHVWAKTIHYEGENKGQGFSPMSVGDVLDWTALCAKLHEQGADSKHSPGRRIWELLPADVHTVVQSAANGNPLTAESKAGIIVALNPILKRGDLYSPKDFEKVTISDPVAALLQRGLKALKPEDAERVNVGLLEASFPEEVVIHKGRARITSDATVIKKDLRIDADLILAYLGDDGQFKKMIATGNVHINTVPPVPQRTKVRPPLQRVAGGRRAIAHRAYYDLGIGIVILTGDGEDQPVAWIEQDQVQADKITLDQKNNKTYFDGNAIIVATVKKGAGGAPGVGAPEKKTPRPRTPPPK